MGRHFKPATYKSDSEDETQESRLMGERIGLEDLKFMEFLWVFDFYIRRVTDGPQVPPF